MPTIRTERPVRRGLHRFQDVYFNGVELRKEVKEQGRTFTNLAEYLKKYHGYRHFDLVAGTGKRIGTELWIQVRHRNLLDRLFNPKSDGGVWQDGKAMATHQRTADR